MNHIDIQIDTGTGTTGSGESRMVVRLFLPLLHTVVPKNRPPAILTNNFDKYWSVSLIFGRPNLQRVSNVYMHRLTVLTKWYQLGLIL